MKRVPSVPRYPIYIVSKGRSDCCLTARFLKKEGVPFRLVVEPQEREAYAKEFGDEPLLVLPFSNLKAGSTPARNWIWEHAIAAGSARHWILDDNIRGVWRRWNARKIRCDSGVAFRACEDFVDRYENVGIAGLNYFMFAPNKIRLAPFFLNVHVYSCMLIRNDLPQRWRGRYNEDVDLCLQVLTAGYCTILFNAFLAWKEQTMKMKGGNTAEIYGEQDSRLRATRALVRKWPGVVSLTRRFRRPQHVVKGSWRFFDTPLKRKSEAPTRRGSDEYGLELVQLKEPKSPVVRAMVESRRKVAR